MVEIKTFEYKTLEDSKPVLLDVHFPPLPETDAVLSLPLVVYFHSGGLFIGGKEYFVPQWLIDRCLSLGYAFVSANYRLLIPATGLDIVEDIKDLFKFVVNREFKGDKYTFRLDSDRIAVAGSSAGGLCALLAAMYWTPRPKAIINIYGVTGDFFTPFHLDVKKTETVFVGKSLPLLQPAGFAPLVYPFPHDLPTVTDLPFDLEALLQDAGNSNPANPRLTISSLLHQQGTYLDYYIGLHDPSISEAMRVIIRDEKHTVKDIMDALPKQTHGLFPSFYLDSPWPPTILLHGTADEAVSIEDARQLKNNLQSADTLVELIEVEGQHHGFDCFPGSNIHKAHYDHVVEFIVKHL